MFVLQQSPRWHRQLQAQLLVPEFPRPSSRRVNLISQGRPHHSPETQWRGTEPPRWKIAGSQALAGVFFTMWGTWRCLLLLVQPAA